MTYLRGSLADRASAAAAASRPPGSSPQQWDDKRAIVEPMRGRIPQLDGVRGIAILLVLVWHYSLLLRPEFRTLLAYAAKAVSLSWSGVDLFFVLSGFLIGGILIHNRGAPNYFSVFFVRRAFADRRLTALRGGALCSVSRGGELPPDTVVISPAWYATFTQNIWMVLTDSWRLMFAVTWSLAVEEQFYWFAPLLVAVIAPNRLFGVALALSIVALGIRCLLVAKSSEAMTPTHVLLPCRMDALFLGVVAAILVRTRQAWLTSHIAWLYTVLVILAAILAVATAFNSRMGLGSPFMQSGGLTLLAIFYAAFLLIAVTEYAARCCG